MSPDYVLVHQDAEKALLEALKKAVTEMTQSKEKMSKARTVMGISASANVIDENHNDDEDDEDDDSDDAVVDAADDDDDDDDHHHHHDSSFQGSISDAALSTTEVSKSKAEGDTSQIHMYDICV